MTITTEEQKRMIREFFAPVADNALSDEECDNIWIYGCSKPDEEMIARRKR